MSFDVLEDVNYLAVVVAALAWFALGSVWYLPPVMGRAWMRSADIQIPEGTRPAPMLFIGTLMAYLVAAIATAMLARATGSETFGEGMRLGIVTGVGFALTTLAVGALYERRPEPGTWFSINGAFNFIGYIVVAVIVTIWS
jgi:hypothetical protein